MSRYTVVWNPATKDRLAELWLINRAIRKEITAAVNRIDCELANVPGSVGTKFGESTRFVVLPPIAILFRIDAPNRQVQVMEVKLWDA